MSSEWQAVGAIPPASLGEARLQLHYGALVLGSVAHSLLEALPDDSHTNLGFDRNLVSLHTNPLTSGAEPTELHLRIATMTLELREGSVSAASFALAGRSLQDALDRIQSLARESITPGARIERREYPDFPSSPIMTGGKFVEPDAARLEELARWFANALLLMERLSVGYRDMSAIRTWPHHFDIGALIPLDGERGTSIGVGLSPGDANYDEPYFYCSPYPPPRPSRLDAIELGHWHTDGFVSAVLTASELLAANGDPELLAARYLGAAIEQCATLLE